MGGLRQLVIERPTREDGTLAFKLKLPLTDGKEVSLKLFMTSDKQLRLKVLDKFSVGSSKDDDGPLKTNGGQDLGLNFNAFMSEYAVLVVREFLEREGNTIEGASGVTTFLVEVGKQLMGPVDGTDKPQREWRINPEITEPIKGLDAKYLLMQDDGAHHLAWLGKDEEKDLFHWMIRSRLPPSALVLGGGLIGMDYKRLALAGESTDFGRPPFDLLYDAARAVIKTTSNIVPIERMTIQGAVTVELPFG